MTNSEDPDQTIPSADSLWYGSMLLLYAILSEEWTYEI